MKYIIPLCVLLLCACSDGGGSGGRSGRAAIVQADLSFPAVLGFDLHLENVDGRVTWYDESDHSWIFCRRLSAAEVGTFGRNVARGLKKGALVIGTNTITSLGNCLGEGQYADTIDASGRFCRILVFEAKVGEQVYLITGTCDRGDKTQTVTFYEAVIAKLTLSP